MRLHALLILAAGIPVAADAADDAQAKVLASLKMLNNAYLKKDVDTMKRLMSDDHVAILASGQRQPRDEHLKAVADLKLTEYTMEDVKTTMPGKETIVVTYKSTVKGTFKGVELPPKVMASSVWTNRNGTWLEVLYQETPLPVK